jgi:SAM-dependent methyltransferase
MGVELHRPVPVRVALSGLPATSDFSPVAARYDATRDVPELLLAAGYARMAGQGILPKGAVILDAGCGTGQISLPLAEAGHVVRGYDVSAAMVAIARGKARAHWQAAYAVGDVRCLPEEDAAFDTVVVSKLFQHVPGWQQACMELLRVLRPGGTLVHIAERGAFGNPVRRYFAAVAEGMGFTNRFPGLRRRADLVAFLGEQGCVEAPVDLTDLAWRRQLTYGDAWDQLEERLFAEFWGLPDSAYAHILADAAAWIDALPYGRDTVAELTPYLSADIVRKPAD